MSECFIGLVLGCQLQSGAGRYGMRRRMPSKDETERASLTVHFSLSDYAWASRASIAV
jgi:hypothetical protein